MINKECILNFYNLNLSKIGFVVTFRNINLKKCKNMEYLS